MASAPFLDVLSHINHFSFGVLVTYGTSAALVILACLICYIATPRRKGSIRTLGGFPVLTAWTFFTRRYDFLWDNFKKNPSPHFKFNVLHVRILQFNTLQRSF